MTSFAVVRGDNLDKVKIALHDMQHHGKINFRSTPRNMVPEDADNLLVSVMGVPLKSNCIAAAVVELGNNAGVVINKLRKIHPPAHIVVVSPRHEAFNDLLNNLNDYPEFNIDLSSLERKA
ncbi:DUF356 domain-containing protein [Methanosalsum natronophilum]|uniref:DUF356 domain-containing protein n=1 Tax=Methanosalsum natronophilum TaxID=768733 RepID=A0A3R7WA50_9EURY|nr:MAG: DUF356 domain-containing protein [Methanosalsum natronophilum]